MMLLHHKKGNNEWLDCLSMEFKGPYGRVAVTTHSMVCIGKNIANCSKTPQFISVIRALCKDAPKKDSSF